MQSRKQIEKSDDTEPEPIRNRIGAKPRADRRRAYCDRIGSEYRGAFGIVCRVLFRIWQRFVKYLTASLPGFAED